MEKASDNWDLIIEDELYIFESIINTGFLRKLVRNIFFAVNILFAVALLATYLVQEVNPSTFWIPSVLGLVYPYLLIANVLFVGFWLIFKQKYMLLSVVCILAGMHINTSYFQLFGRRTSENVGIKVLSYNVQNFYSYLGKKKNRGAIIDYIAAQKADIICLQETKLQKEGDLNPLKLKMMFPGIKHCQLAHQSKWAGPVTFSSYPIVSMGEIRFEDTKNMVIFSNLKIGKDTVRVYNCHLQSYGINTSAYSVIDTLGFEPEKLKEMRKIGSKLKWGNIYRSKQVMKLNDHIKKCPYPVIVCGDFNDTPISFTYGKMSSQLKDSFVGSGRGVSNTYRGKLPQNRIDYIFHSNVFKAYNYKRHSVGYSDHYPISTLLVRKK
jgi:endonuclease/exonuclease/phosphatase family metal-dependent hydrolase